MLAGFCDEPKSKKLRRLPKLLHVKVVYWFQVPLHLKVRLHLQKLSRLQKP